MKKIITVACSLLLPVAIFSMIAITSASAQTFKRSTIFEEFTGAWCPHCPIGSFSMDSLEVKYGESAVVLCWHGGPGIPSNIAYDPNYTPLTDTIAAVFGIGGWPMGLMSRGFVGGFVLVSPPAIGQPMWILDAQYPALVSSFLNQAPTVDYRIVNATYDPATRKVSFDVDITPFNMSTMRSDDTTVYSTIGVITEDNVVASQENAGDWSVVPAGAIDDFHNQNVVRASGGSAIYGDKYTLGTKTPTEALPLRKHYTINVKAGWVASNIRIKSFTQATFPKNGKTINFDVLEAKQTAAITTLPSVAAPSVWIVTPNEYAKPTSNIVSVIWAKGGSVSAGKFEYSLNGGSTWNPIVGAESVTTSPYKWTTSFTTDQTITLRVSDPANSAVNGVSAPFDVKAVKSSFTITAPKANEKVVGGTTNYVVKFTALNVGTQRNFELTTDGGTTWTPITGSAAANTFTWALVPDVATTQAMIRVSDENSVTGMSGMFEITSKVGTGSITSISLDGLVSGKIGNGSQLKISWTYTGDIGTYDTVKLSRDNGATWNVVPNGIVKTGEGGITANPVIYQTPLSGNYPSCYVSVSSNKGLTYQYPASGDPGFQIGQGAGVYTTAANGYSLANYPNPFANETTIKFEIPVRTSVTVRITDNLGRNVEQFVTKTLEAGEHTLQFNASSLSNGVYTYSLEAEATKLVGKMSVVK
ncbi:MAG: T9SS type A sorting domain-containing protein [bacterium]